MLAAWIDIAQTELTAPRQTRVHDIVTAAALHFRITEAEIKGASRKQRFALPRQIAMFLAREMTAASYPVIARVIGGRDHTTILWGDRKIAAAIMDGNAGVIAHVQAIREMVLTGSPKSVLRSHLQTLELVAQREAQEAARHVEKMRQLRRLRDLANAGFIASSEERVMAS
ncbi:Chromosomal replication initiator, DnaA C-terminal [uncultured Caudovirales phage]|uniref:Chromosomal replication initiator, DnaA C-terminal n=1 Tax=uncultured Caudovirales phage TaxID=2100421 RepID=A0A6J5S1Z6_9CAUD|nr:Chromosomal replication initiator, DnaA C-terminal [uncultured Caudovirales phage]